MRISDFRSDTFTKPSKVMRQVMCEAEVGDDVFGEDPTVNRLQEIIAELSGKEAALFVSSGTQGNQICLNAHTRPGSEVIVGRESHIFNYEAGAPALLSGVQLFPIDDSRGWVTLEEVKNAARHEDVHYPQTQLICLENTHNRAGGTIFPLEEIEKISQFARQGGYRIHLDGARLWNAVVETGISVNEYSKYFESISLCFSKGLGAPVGSIVAGSKDFIKEVHYYRKVYGGGMRQVGMLAAACIYALNNNLKVLKKDHERAKYFAEEMFKIPGINIDMATVQTNIVIFSVVLPGFRVNEFLFRLKENGVLMLNIGHNRVRMVCHLDLEDADIERAILVMRKLLA
jgi:threonine aldolase